MSRLHNLPAASNRLAWGALFMKDPEGAQTMSRHAMYTLLLVDDNPRNVFTLRTLLEEALDVEILEALSGREALEKISQHKIDLILLDIKMPDIDGFEVARLIRNRKRYEAIPIIFLTAVYKSEEFKQRGLEGGAIDYLTKPLDDTILLNRVGAYLRLIENERTLNHQLERINAELQAEIEERRQVERALQELNEQLEQRVKARTAELQQANQALENSLETLRKAQEQLIQSEKMAALGGLVAGVSHEISTPIGIGVTAVSHLQEKSLELQQQYQQGRMTRTDLETYLKTATDSAEIILRNLQRAAEQMQGFKQIAVDQTSGEKRRFQLKPYLEEVIRNLHPKLKKTQHTVRIEGPDDIVLESYPGAFSQILTNLVMNSLIHGFEHHQQGEIVITIAPGDNGMLRLLYRDNGRGMAEDERTRIFEPFYTTKREQGGSGLGLNIVHNVVTHQIKGRIACDSQPGQGTTFLIDIPANQKET
ncbi:response regulator [candidate division KSB3 bacterium]|uniref:histidine kinase n=1 Tax=candidate division KSB3 bacterium TaxID=2044937 RepID=A0A9D5JZR4_9BACT|nr:response regulator [candidate division KSB3 bacterium]MBD3327218.1 response regulator [candidate division KSB3 bacterium]